MKTANAYRLRHLIGFVRSRITDIDEECGPQPKFGEASFEQRDAWWKRRDAAEQRAIGKLMEEGAVCSIGSGHSYSIRLGGIRSSSTAGWAAAFRNWISAAEKRVAMEAS